jgi:hypothetical protein
VAAAGVVGAGVVGGLALRRRFRRRRDELVAALSTDEGTAPGTYDPDAVAALPSPVRRYFETVLDPGQALARSARIEQRGEIRIGSDPAWRSFEATNHVATDPPGFVWDARVEMAPLLAVRVLDASVGGEGLLRARLFGVVPVADATPGTTLDEGELLRYLAEAPWVPTALLPARGVEWEGIDDDSARATLSTGGTTVSATFHFEDGVVDRVTARRPYTNPDGSQDPVPWTGYWDDYEERGGMLVPTRGAVEWNRTDGDWRYWRGRLTDVTYR